MYSRYNYWLSFITRQLFLRFLFFFYLTAHDWFWIDRNENFGKNLSTSSIKHSGVPWTASKRSGFILLSYWSLLLEFIILIVSHCTKESTRIWWKLGHQKRRTNQDHIACMRLSSFRDHKRRVSTVKETCDGLKTDSIYMPSKTPIQNPTRYMQIMGTGSIQEYTVRLQTLPIFDI